MDWCCLRLVKPPADPKDYPLNSVGDLFRAQWLVYRRAMHEKHGGAFDWRIPFLEFLLRSNLPPCLCERTVEDEVTQVVAGVHRRIHLLRTTRGNNQSAKRT